MTHKITISLTTAEVEQALKEHLKTKYPYLDPQSVVIKIGEVGWGRDVTQGLTGVDVVMHPAKVGELKPSPSTLLFNHLDQQLVRKFESPVYAYDTNSGKTVDLANNRVL